MPEKRSLLRPVARVGKPLVVLAVFAGLLGPGVAAHAEPSLTELERQISKDAEALEKVIESYNGINEQLKATRIAIAAHNAKLVPLKAEMDEVSARVGEMAAIAYKGGAMMEYNAVLDSGGSADLLDRIGTLDHLARYQQGEVARATQNKSQFEAETVRLNKLLTQQSTQLGQLGGKKTQIERDIGRLESLRRQARARQTAASRNTSSGSSGSSGGSSSSNAKPPAVSGGAGKAVRFAYNALGIPYRWGGESSNGYDCSGLTMAAWKAAGVSLPHNAASQYRALPHISRSSLRPGDLVFYSGLGHVGIYVGNNQIIHAPQTGDVVRLASVDMMSPYGYARPS